MCSVALIVLVLRIGTLCCLSTACLLSWISSFCQGPCSALPHMPQSAISCTYSNSQQMTARSLALTCVTAASRDFLLSHPHPACVTLALGIAWGVLVLDAPHQGLYHMSEGPLTNWLFVSECSPAWISRQQSSQPYCTHDSALKCMHAHSGLALGVGFHQQDDGSGRLYAQSHTTLLIYPHTER